MAFDETTKLITAMHEHGLVHKGLKPSHNNGNYNISIDFTTKDETIVGKLAVWAANKGGNLWGVRMGSSHPFFTRGTYSLNGNLPSDMIEDSLIAAAYSIDKHLQNPGDYVPKAQSRTEPIFHLAENKMKNLGFKNIDFRKVNGSFSAYFDHPKEHFIQHLKYGLDNEGKNKWDFQVSPHKPKEGPFQLEISPRSKASTEYALKDLEEILPAYFRNIASNERKIKGYTNFFG